MNTFQQAVQPQNKADQFRAERRQVWANAWAMTANANDCKSTEVATRYADRCLEAFDLRFRNDFL
jgi:hypothetical protein